MSAVCSLIDRSGRRRRRVQGLPLALALTLGAAAVASEPAAPSAPEGSSAIPAAAHTEAATGASGEQALRPPPAALPCNEPLCYTATRLEATRNHIALTDIEIVDTTRGTTQIKADHAEATGLDLGNSRWVLTGHVQVYMPQGQLQASAATIQFTDKRIASIAADGSPAQFERQVLRSGQATPTNVTGHAQQITYDVARNQVALNGDSWLTDGCNDISTQQITYDIASQRVEASAAPGANGRVHGTIGAGARGPCVPAIGHP
jgi:lipopolysaccharide transport protein LptA